MTTQKEIHQNLESSDNDTVLVSLKHIRENGTLGDLPALIKLGAATKNPTIKKASIQVSTKLILENLLTKFSEIAPEYREKLGNLMQSLDPRILEEIAKELYSDDDSRRLTALQVLGLLKKHPKVRDILAKLVQDRDEKIRATAVHLMGSFVDPRDHQFIMSLLQDKDKRVRANTVEALEELGNKRLVPILLRFRKDPSNRIRGNVLKAIFNLGYKEIEEDITGMLNDKDNFMKASSLWVISQTGFTSPKVVDLCAYCLIFDDEMIYRNAVNALNAMDSPRASGFLRYLSQIKEKEELKDES